MTLNQSLFFGICAEGLMIQNRDCGRLLSYLERLIKLFFAFCSSEQEKVVSLHEIFCGLCEWTQQDKLTIYKYDKYNIAGRFGKAI